MTTEKPALEQAHEAMAELLKALKARDTSERFGFKQGENTRAELLEPRAGDDKIVVNLLREGGIPFMETISAADIEPVSRQDLEIPRGVDPMTDLATNGGDAIQMAFAADAELITKLEKATELAPGIVKETNHVQNLKHDLETSADTFNHALKQLETDGDKAIATEVLGNILEAARKSGIEIPTPAAGADITLATEDGKPVVTISGHPGGSKDTGTPGGSLG